MSLDITVHNPETDQSIEMNWLRNPFGLCTWAEDNYVYFTEREPPEDKTLWYVINHWNYDKAENVDRPLFLEVVKRYGDVIMKLDKAYFWFSEGSFNQFILPDIDKLPPSSHQQFQQYGFEPTVRYHFDQKEYLGIPMGYLGHSCFHLSDRYRPNAHTLKHYQNWYQELIDFAEMLQVPGTTFYCSN